MRLLRVLRVPVPVLAGIGLVVGGPALAQSGSDASKTLDTLANCQAITADAARLACFDTAAGQIASARKSGDLLALDRGKVIARKRQRFGLADAAQNPLGGGDADRLTTVTEVRTTITRAKPSSYARYALQLANDTVWETIEPLTLQPKPDTAIVIKQAGFGGFRATIAGERPILVKRQR